MDLLPGTPDPLVNADPTARIARLARGARPLGDAERQQRQVAMSCSVLDPDEAGAGCTQVLHLAVFFDGTGNNRDEEMAKPVERRALSNIAKLRFAHVAEANNITNLYLAGVGTPCPEVGDKGGTAGLAFGKGGGERVDYAFEKLDELIDKQTAKKILIINVSVFGFSRGAAQARAFVRDLAARCKAQPDGTWHYRDIPLRVAFVGIFDTVCSVWSGFVTALFNARDGHGEWAHDVKLPPIVEQCVHMTAAHELRPQFPLDSTRDDARYPSNTVEIWYPGVHSDVGGGYDPAHQGRKNSISRFSLNEMYDMARMAGVLLRPVPDLASHVQDEFNKEDEELRSAYNGYLQAVRLKQGRSEMVQAAHMELLHRWLKVRIERGENLASVQQLREREAALNAELLTLYRKKRRLKDPYNDRGALLSTQEMAEWKITGDAIRERRSELSEVKSQRKGLIREADVLGRRMAALHRKRDSGRELTMSELTMLQAWGNTAPLPKNVELFFDGYGHDSTSHWFAGNLSKWRTIYFGDTKYKPESISDNEWKPVDSELLAAE
ncbi:phospholipase effector Tle1 domain-containing protein [Pseudoxanthomonas mexicana]|uniref:phospholipase effector Tle1 domain-containing protein n=1 Tax=Pseudoxanthomonas mexicana TaxID=128785 RepID=UPI00398A7FC2